MDLSLLEVMLQALEVPAGKKARAKYLAELEARAREIEDSAVFANVRVRETGEAITALRADLARMALVVEALVRLVVEKKLATKEELRSLMTAIDLEDGRADGQLGGEPPPVDPATVGKPCPSCGHRLTTGAKKCVYCGAKL